MQSQTRSKVFRILAIPSGLVFAVLAFYDAEGRFLYIALAALLLAYAVIGESVSEGVQRRIHSRIRYGMITVPLAFGLIGAVMGYSTSNFTITQGAVGGGIVGAILAFIALVVDRVRRK